MNNDKYSNDSILLLLGNYIKETDYPSLLEERSSNHIIFLNTVRLNYSTLRQIFSCSVYSKLKGTHRLKNNIPTDYLD